MYDSKRTVLITGASRGIGRETASQLAEEFDHVVTNYFKEIERTEETATKVEQRGAKALIVPGDVCDPNDVQNLKIYS